MCKASNGNTLTDSVEPKHTSCYVVTSPPKIAGSVNSYTDVSEIRF